MAEFLPLILSKSTWWQLGNAVDEMTTLETGHFRLPPQLELNLGNVSEKSVKWWKQQVEV